VRALTRSYPYVLIVALAIVIVAAIVLNDGAKGAPSRTARIFILEPAGPKPRILYPPPSDFKNLGSGLKQIQARQQVALQHYRVVFRSYLSWRQEKIKMASPETDFILQPIRFRCKATNVVMPSNWCWYASAYRWTLREIEETKVRILAERTLPDPDDWVTAVRAVQRVYPGTESWLLSCSDAESDSHGPWVWFRGRPWRGYHIGNDYLGMDTVGGWMQFRWTTFKPYWYGYWGAAGALADTRTRGFIVPDLGEGYGPWLRPLGQALTAGYMRFTGRDGHHWSASHGRGC
jgi:hypothetical protein